MKFTGVTIGNVRVTLIGPDGVSVAAITANSGIVSDLDTVGVPINGTYQILLDPSGTDTGSITLTLYDVPPDVSGTIVPGGAPVTVTTTAVGQNGVLTFSGTAGKRIFLKMT